MTHDELIAKAEERIRTIHQSLQRSEKVSPAVRRLNIDDLRKRTIRDAVFIRFESDDDRGQIEVLMDSQTGEIFENKFIPPKKSGDKAS